MRRPPVRKKQFEMFGQYVRRADLEDRSFYAAVQYLRSHGCTCIKISNRQSKVDSRLLSNKQLMSMAEDRGWGR